MSQHQPGGTEAYATWVANWRDPKAYPALDAWGGAYPWRWEFIRRHPEYLQDMKRWADAGAAAKRQAAAEHPVAWSPSGESDPFTGKPLQQQARARYRTWRLLVRDLQRELHTKWGFDPDSAWPQPDTPHWHSLLAGSKSTPYVPPLRLDSEPDDLAVGLERTNELQVWIRFDLDDHVGQQLKSAKRILDRTIEALERKGLHSKPSHRERQRSVLQKALRVLDGIASGATKKEIAAVLFPDVPNEYPDYAGSKCVKDVLKDAHGLLNFGFRSINVAKYG